MTRGYDPQRLFERLHAAGVRYVIIGGWAVNAHGHRRFTGDLHICPDPAFDNLSRLADLLAGLNARQVGVEDFEPDELPGDPTDAANLAAGGNSRTETDDGILHIMQWISGDDRELGYDQLADDAIHVAVFGTPMAACSLNALLEMKRASGRPQDLEDLNALQAWPRETSCVNPLPPGGVGRWRQPRLIVTGRRRSSGLRSGTRSRTRRRGVPRRRSDSSSASADTHLHRSSQDPVNLCLR